MMYTVFSTADSSSDVMYKVVQVVVLVRCKLTAYIHLHGEQRTITLSCS